MNEKLIGDLFAVATARMTGSSSREFSQKFAELIVRECIGVVQKGGGMCGAISSNNLKQHFFGVEE